MTSKISGKLQNQDISIFSPKNNFVWYTILIEPQEWRSFLIQEHFEIVGHPNSAYCIGCSGYNIIIC